MITDYEPLTVAVITLSDRGAAGLRDDLSGALLRERLSAEGYRIVEYLLLPDDEDRLKGELIRLADEVGVNLIITTGGTGFAPRDVTPEATMAVATRNAPGIAEAIRAESMKITPRAMLSRAVSVIRNRTLIVNLPGSRKAVGECLDVCLSQLEHGLNILLCRDGECGRS
jgi:molybdenum cofactor synthesis domain-containing protein